MLCLCFCCHRSTFLSLYCLPLDAASPANNQCWYFFCDRVVCLGDVAQTQCTACNCLCGVVCLHTQLNCQAWAAVCIFYEQQWKKRPASLSLSHPEGHFFSSSFSCSAQRRNLKNVSIKRISIQVAALNDTFLPFIFGFLLESEWPWNTLLCKADAGIMNEPNRRDLKYLCFGSTVCWVHVLGLASASFTVLALGSFHIRLRVWPGAAATAKCSCHLSSLPLLFAPRKKENKTALNGPEAVICCWQTGTVLAADALTLPLWADSWLSSPGTAVFVHTATCF